MHKNLKDDHFHRLHYLAAIFLIFTFGEMQFLSQRCHMSELLHILHRFI